MNFPSGSLRKWKRKSLVTAGESRLASKCLLKGVFPCHSSSCQGSPAATKLMEMSFVNPPVATDQMSHEQAYSFFGGFPLQIEIEIV